MSTWHLQFLTRRKFGLKPRETHRFGTVRAMIAPAALWPNFDTSIGHQGDLHCRPSRRHRHHPCFVLGSPCCLWRGEIQCRGLGMAVDVWDDDGKPVRGEKGELVCSKPFPVMPIGFWNDADGSKYHAAYFDRFDNVWCHGDFCEITAHGGLVIYGRSDATLNPAGCASAPPRSTARSRAARGRRVAGDRPGLAAANPSDVRVVLFVKLREGLALDDELVRRIRQTIRDNTTPRHVPAKVLQVADIPRTRAARSSNWR